MSTFPGPRDWGRLLTAMLTPFNSDGSVNEKEVARIAAHLVDDQKNDGLVVAGTTGESPTLTHEEKRRLLEITLDTVGDRAAVVMGAGTYNTTESIEMTRAAEKRGAHGIMLVNPYYNKPGQAGLFAHFSTIAAETGLPVMLYNIQPRGSINLVSVTLLRLAEIPVLVAVKEGSGDHNQLSDVCARKPEGFRVYSGDDGLCLPILSVGGHGLVSVAAHVLGQSFAEMISSFPTDPARSTQIHQQVLGKVRAVFSAPSPVPIKYLLAKRGFDCESVRLPLVALSEQEKARIDQAFA